MADIRINALATTATSSASDDYVAIDGSANGTRKILATNIANNVTDVILGSSGPSVKSTLSARAPRQGLVFDGTAGATVANVPAFGTGDFSLDIVANTVDATKPNYIFAGDTGCFACLSLGDGSLYYFKPGGNSRNVSNVFVSNKTTRVTLSKASGVIKTYVNGVLVDTWTDTNDAGGGYTAPIIKLGGYTTQYWVGYLSAQAYNRALSASEVVALYEAGAPAGADYNSASNTALNVATFTNSNIYPYGTFSGASTTGFTAVSNGTGFQAAFANTSITFKTGTKYRLTYTLTLNSGAAPFFVLGNPGVSGYSTAVQLSAGTNSVEVTATGSATSAQGFGFQHNSSAGNYSISNISLVPVGLLLAPDAAQAGGGLVWYDTSGNAANITLPASGVSWNVPSSLKLGGNWNLAGTLTSTVTSGSSPILTASNTSSGGYSIIRAQNDVGGASGNFDLGIGGSGVGGSYQNWGYLYTGGGLSGIRFATTATIQMTLNNSGNVLIGTTTDGGQKLQVAGTAYVSGDATFAGKVTATTALISSDYVQCDATGAYNLGNPTTDGTWRFVISGTGNLLIQRRESGAFVTKSTISA